MIISGTGSIAYGRNAAGEAARSGGWGYVLGDEGSGYWIGRAALRAVLRAADLRGPGTLLTQMLLDHFQVSQPQLLLHEVYHHHLKPAAIGALASCVQTAFSEGDEAATGILRGAADELEGAALSVARRLGSDGRGLHLHPVGRHLSGGAVAGAGAVAAAAAGGAAQLDETARS